jgi:hypothetical protein
MFLATEVSAIGAESRAIGCRVEPYWIKAAPLRAAPLARRQRRALPWRPARRTPGHTPARSRSKPAHNAQPVAMCSRLPRRISVPGHGRRLKGAYGVARDRRSRRPLTR